MIFRHVRKKIKRRVGIRQIIMIVIKEIIALEQAAQRKHLIKQIRPAHENIDSMIPAHACSAHHQLTGAQPALARIKIKDQRHQLITDIMKICLLTLDAAARIASKVRPGFFIDAVAAKELNVALRGLQNYEYGNAEPRLSILIRMADFYGVSIDYLAGRTDTP